MKQLFIPDRINVGFQNRTDTYTQKLAYIIYYDQKGELRKEKSWQGWRDQKIPNVEFTNEPTEGFVLNKGVGGGRSSWNHRNEYIRVYDPRDFEFEISVANLLFILRECDCSRGKGLEGKFVYAWDGTELVLLPERSAEFQHSKKFTSLQSQSVKSKDLIPGATYTTKRQKQLVFLGRFDYHDVVYRNDPKDKTDYWKRKENAAVVKKFVFWNGERLISQDNIKNIAALIQSEPIPNFADLVQLYYKSPHGSPVVSLRLKPHTAPKAQNDWRCRTWFWEDPSNPGMYIEYHDGYIYHQDQEADTQSTNAKVQLKDGVLVSTAYHTTAYKSEVAMRRYSWSSSQIQRGTWRTRTNLSLWAKLESGSEYRVESHELIERKDDNGTEN